MDFDEVAEIILREVEFFPGITRTHHTPRVKKKLPKSVRWTPILDYLIANGKIEERLKIVDGRPVRVYYPVKDDIGTNEGSLGESTGEWADAGDD